MRKSILGALIVLCLGLLLAPAHAGEVAIYTGGVGWIDQPSAVAQATICRDTLNANGITANWYATVADDALLAAWVTSKTNNGEFDALVLYGFVPPLLYTPGNTQTDGSLLELFIESTDGDLILNHADYMFYVTNPCCNGEAALPLIMDIPGMDMWTGLDPDVQPVTITSVASTIAPSLTITQTNRPFHINELAGEWYLEASLAQNGAGTRADPVIVRDGNRGRLAIAYQAPDQPAAPRGAVAAEMITYLVDKQTTQLSLSGPTTTVQGTPVRYRVQLQDDLALPASADASVTVTLDSDSATGVFDTTRKGAFNGTVTSVTIPAGSVNATFYYKDDTATLANLTVSATGLPSATLQVNVVEDLSGDPGEVAIYTGNVGWTTKEVADAQAQILVDRLNLLGIPNELFGENTDQEQQDLASWVTDRTNDGQLDVVVTFGYFPFTLYECANVLTDGSIAEAFIESTDGDAFMNHADYMFYVSGYAGGTACYNGDAGLINMMDTPVYMWDDHVMNVTQDGRDISPSLVEYQSASGTGGPFFWTYRPLHVNELAGEWFVEAVLAENPAGTRSEPIIVRDGNRGRLIPAFQTTLDNSPRGAVATEIIAWLHGIDLANPVKLGILGRSSVTVGLPLTLTVQAQSFLGSPAFVAADTTVTLTSTSGTGRFDTSLGGSFDGTVTSVTIPADGSFATFYYKDPTAGTPTLTASAAGLTSGTLAASVVARTFAPAGEVAMYTGATWWITKARADEQATLCSDRLAGLGISTEIFADVLDKPDLATWVTNHRGDGKLDVLVLFGCFPGSIYPTGNTQTNFSPAERFIESTDGDAIINVGDWMFYVDYLVDHSTVATDRVENAAAGLQNMMDIPGISMAGGDNPMTVTADGALIAPSLVDYLTDRPLHVTELAGQWLVEASLAQSADGTLADPVIVRDGPRGRLIPVMQADSQADPQGAVVSEIIAWLMQKSFAATKLGITGTSEVLKGTVAELQVQLQDSSGVGVDASSPIVVTLATSSGTGAFDTTAGGPFNGSVTSVTIPAGQDSATFYYKDPTAALVTLTASAAGLANGVAQVDVYQYLDIPAGEVAIYTGATSWISTADALTEATTCSTALTAAGITNTVFADVADEAALATWVQERTGNGRLDVLVLYGWFPTTLYAAGNGQPDGSIAEAFIESTDGDAILNHADWMFYVSNPNNTGTGLQNMMDLPAVNMAGYDDTAVTVTALGNEIAPSLGDFNTDRPLWLNTLGGSWWVEAVLAQSADGTLAEPVIVRDANRGRLIPCYQTNTEVNPKGQVAAEIIIWLMPDGGTPTTQFRRGDANADGSMNITDGIYVLNYLFLGGDTPTCLEAANANNDAEVNITDGIYILNYLFLGGAAPEPPGELTCGPDPEEAEPDAVTCEGYASC